MSSSSTISYLYNNNLTVQNLDEDLVLQTRNRVAYSRTIKIYRGVDAEITLYIQNSDQKPANIANKSFTFTINADQDNSRIWAAPMTTTDISKAITTVIIDKSITAGLEQEYYEYIVTYTDGNVTLPTYVDSNWDAIGQIQVMQGVTSIPSVPPPSTVSSVVSKDYVDVQIAAIRANIASTDASLREYIATQLAGTSLSSPVNADWLADFGEAEILNKPTIPVVPTTISSFINDSNYQTASNVAATLINKANKASTLSGYGITDAYTKTAIDTIITTKMNAANTIAGYGITDAYTKPEINTIVATKANAAGTLAGYGISDAYTKTTIDTLLSTKIGTEILSLVATSGSYIDLRDKPAIFSGSYTDLRNKPLVPTVVSALANDSDYQTKIEVVSAIEAVVGAAPAALDTLGEIANQLADDQNVVGALITTVSTKANIASTLAGYGITDAYTKTQVDTGLATKANIASTLDGYGISDAYTKIEVDTGLATKANIATTLDGYGISDAYTKTQVDNALSDKATFNYVDTGLATKANIASTLGGYGITDAYTKIEVDAGLATKANIASTLAGYGITDAYTKTQVDNAFTDTVNYVDTGLATKANIASTLGGYGITDANTKIEVDAGLATKANISSLANVATTGSYTDLIDKPTLPTNISAFINDAGYIINDAGYIGGSGLDSNLSLKVDKIPGMGLSSNDFTDTYKDAIIDFANITNDINIGITNLALNIANFGDEIVAERNGRIDAISLLVTKTEANAERMIEQSARRLGDTTTLTNANAYTDDAIVNIANVAINSAITTANVQATAYTNKVKSDTLLTVSSEYLSKDWWVDPIAGTGELRDLHREIDAKLASSANITLADAVEYTDSVFAQAAIEAAGLAGEILLANATAYTDSAITSEVTSRTSAITTAIANEATARTYAITNAIASAKAYTDLYIGHDSVTITQLTQAEANANAYADDAISNVTAGAIDSAITTANVQAAAYTNNVAISTLQTVSSNYLLKDWWDDGRRSGELFVLRREIADGVTLANLHADTTTLTNAKAYTDSAITSAIAGDTQLIQAKLYADSKDQVILTSARAYADAVSHAAASQTTVAVLTANEALTNVNTEANIRIAADIALGQRIDNLISNTDTSINTAILTTTTAFNEALTIATTSILANATAYTDTSINTAILTTTTAFNEALTIATTSILANAKAYTDASTSLAINTAISITTTAFNEALTIATTSILANAKAYTDSMSHTAGYGTKNYTYSGALHTFVGTIPWIVPHSLTVNTILAYLGSPSTSNDVTIQVIRNVVDVVATITIPQATTYIEIPTLFSAARSDQILISITASGLNATNLQLVFIY